MTFLSQVRSWIAREPQAAGRRVAVFGDSHTAALISAQQFSARKELFEHVRIARVLKEKNGQTIGDATLASFCREIARFGPEDSVFSMVGGNQYAIMSTVRSLVEFDFLTSASDEEVASDAAEMVPLRAIAGYIDDGVRGSIGPVLREIRAATRAQLFHIAPPPPKQDNAYITKHFEGRFRSEGLHSFGPTRPSLRLKCWRLQLQSLGDLCTELNVHLVNPPGKALTPDGYLEPRYYAKDVTHANRRYGEIVLRQILKFSRTADQAMEQPS